MSNKDRPLVERHAPKKGVGWLVNTQQGKVSQFRNDNPTAHAQWVVVETRPITRQWSACGQKDAQAQRNRSLGNHAEVRWVETVPTKLVNTVAVGFFRSTRGHPPRLMSQH